VNEEDLTQWGLWRQKQTKSSIRILRTCTRRLTARLRVDGIRAASKVSLYHQYQGAGRSGFSYRQGRILLSYPLFAHRLWGPRNLPRSVYWAQFPLDVQRLGGENWRLNCI